MKTRSAMKTQKVKRKRLNIARSLVLILVLYIIVCFCIYIYKTPVRHYEISGNDKVKDVEILRYLELTDYPSYISINTKKLKRKLESNKLIISAKVSYGWNFTIKINVVENKPIFKLKSNNNVVLKNGEIIEYDNKYYSLPTLLNNTPDDIMVLFANKLSEVDDGIISMISEIEYNPSYNSNNNVIDKNRFLLYMSDGNLVYVTAKKAKVLNKYLNIIANDSITGNGTLYLDGDENRYSFTLFASGDDKNEN